MKPNILVGAGAAVLVGCLGMAVVGAQQNMPSRDRDDRGGQNGDESRVRTGFEYARAQGITLNLKGRDRGMVGLGSYLVNAVGACNDCHTAPPFTKDPAEFLGAPKQINLECYLAGGTPFGPFVSRDITPWEDGKPAGLTFGRFLHVMRTGEDPDNPGQVLQVMPWPVYQSMTDHDLRAIYEYLSSIPAITANTCGVPSEG
ncbi:MAG: cytochrome C [Acidobacteriota bacterium]